MNRLKNSILNEEEFRDYISKKYNFDIVNTKRFIKRINSLNIPIKEELENYGRKYFYQISTARPGTNRKNGRCHCGRPEQVIKYIKAFLQGRLLCFA